VEIVGATITAAEAGVVAVGAAGVAALGAAVYSAAQGNSPYLSNGYPTSFNLNPTSSNASSSSSNATTQSAPAARQSAQSTPGLPKPPTGPGKTPKDQRDKKRTWSKSENANKLEKQGGKCAQCGEEIDSGKGHHVDRHADGGATNDSNHAVVCEDCHKDLHKPGN